VDKKARVHQERVRNLETNFASVPIPPRMWQMHVQAKFNRPQSRIKYRQRFGRSSCEFQCVQGGSWRE
jgi:hypothetical protein